MKSMEITTTTPIPPTTYHNVLSIVAGFSAAAAAGFSTGAAADLTSMAPHTVFSASKYPDCAPDQKQVHSDTFGHPKVGTQRYCVPTCGHPKVGPLASPIANPLASPSASPFAEFVRLLGVTLHRYHFSRSKRVGCILQHGPCHQPSST